MTITSYSRNSLTYTHYFIFLDTGKTDQQVIVIASATAAAGVGLVAIVLAVLCAKCRIARLLLNRSNDTTEDEQDDMNESL